MKLIRPCDQYKGQFLQMIEAFAEEGTTGFWLHLGGRDSFSYEKFIEVDNQYSKGESLAPGRVQSTTYWLIDNGSLIGQTNIRHELNKGWLEKGGNIGYFISPLHRRKGYGTHILALALAECKKLNIKKALVTCDEGNMASEKIIEKNGGVLENIIEVDGETERTKRYWIDLD